MKKCSHLFAFAIFFSTLTVTYSQTGWFRQNCSFTGWFRSVSFGSALTGWAVGDGGTIFKTTNGGSSWFSQLSGTNQPLWSVKFYDINTGWSFNQNHERRN